MAKKLTYEDELLKSYEEDEWKSVKNLKERKSVYKQYAKNTFLKNKRINIRISEKDLISLKVKSLEEGIPYQSLITTVIHKYLKGKLSEN
ncbi:MAG TPA: antitoxin [Ignavibacteria bacterium]|nr:antitoxin [Ignavibacteria bacterium]